MSPSSTGSLARGLDEDTARAANYRRLCYLFKVKFIDDVTYTANMAARLREESARRPSTTSFCFLRLKAVDSTDTTMRGPKAASFTIRARANVETCSLFMEISRSETTPKMAKISIYSNRSGRATYGTLVRWFVPDTTSLSRKIRTETYEERSYSNWPLSTISLTLTTWTIWSAS